MVNTHHLHFSPVELAINIRTVDNFHNHYLKKRNKGSGVSGFILNKV